MKNVKVLDCTLREAPLEKLMWGDISIQKMIHGLEKARIDIIEVGFLKDENYESGSTSFQRVEEIKAFIPQKKADIMYVALVDYGRYDLKNLSNYDGTSIDAIRICFKHDEIDVVLDYAKQIREKGYEVCIQHVDTMGYTDDQIVNFIHQVNEFQPYAYSVVDTFGAMYRDDAERLTELVAKELDENIWLGFHAHNNLMMADANEQQFIERFIGRRKIIVDSSLYGCGRSAGNAHTELMTHFMNTKQGADYDINELLDLIDTVITVVQEKTTWGYSIPYFIAGMHNAHTFNVKQLLKRHNLKSKDLRAIIGMLDDVQKKAYDYTLLERLYVQYFDKPIDDSNTIKYLKHVFQKRTILLLAPGKSVLENKVEIEQFIVNEMPIVIGINNLIEGYVLDYIFYSGVIRYQNLQYQDYRAAGSPKIILASNIKNHAEHNEYIVNYSSLIKFGWVNIDSSAILLLRLLQRCEINDVYVAGLDGYKSFGQAFYKNELDTGLDEKTRIDHTNDNISMMKDIRKNNPDFMIHFLTESVYQEVFQEC